MNRKKKDEEGFKGATEVGKPGMARSRAIQKRKETLLQEFRVRTCFGFVDDLVANFVVTDHRSRTRTTC